ncbi:hypothetical protein ACFL3C_04960 [Patescibacteria group bacterium]
MADFENFVGPEQGDQVDAAAFEKFKERVKAASAQIKASKIQEQKQRKKESKLIAILLKFVKTQQKKDIMLLIAKLLEENISPVFVLSVVMLGNDEIIKELEAEDQKQIEAPAPTNDPQNRALDIFDREKVLPLEIKLEIDKWMQNIMKYALETPKRLVQTVFDADENIKLPLIQLSAFVLRDFLESKKQETDYEKLKEFGDFFLNGVMKQVKKQVESQKELEKGD